jgi:hypothetical protein
MSNQRVMHWRRFSIITLTVVAVLIASDQAIPVGAGTGYSFNWSGTPTTPLSVVPATWDVQIHQRDEAMSGDTTFPMLAQHGADCSAPPATHPITTLPESVFICKDHLMTAIDGVDYGEIALTPDHMADWSTGTTAITVQVSTLQLNTSDWVEVWVTPFADNSTLPFRATDPDLQGPPKNALVFAFNTAELFATTAGDVSRVDNFNFTPLPRASAISLASITAPSAVTRTTYEMDISSGHVRFGLPQFGVWWTDTNIAPLPYSQGVVTLTHHSYNPEKHQPGTGVDTWHWSNFAISNAVPFTIINGVERSVHQSGATTVHFPAPAPANAFLRFSAIGPLGSTYMVSYDGGATWVSPSLQSQLGTRDEHFSTYWTPVPAGTQTVMFRGRTWWGGDWWVRDPAIWSQSGSTAPPPPPPPPPPATTPTPTPVIVPTPSPIQLPQNITNMPCTVLMNGIPQRGTCSGTFTHN